MKKTLTLCLMLLMMGCETKAPTKIKQDHELFDQGMRFYEKERYISAMDYFVEIKNRFPESRFQQEARILLADSYFFSHEYIDAEIEYQQFTTLYPLYKDISSIWLKLGKSQFHQAPKSHEKDLTQLKIAKTTFTKVVRKWPGSDEAVEASSMIDKIIKEEIKKQLYVANFYYRTKKYPIAIKKLEELSLATTNDTDLIAERNVLLGKSYLKNNQPQKAALIFSAILQNPDLKTAHAQSKKYLSRITEPQTGL